jgi:predicted Zn-dependent protease
VAGQLLEQRAGVFVARTEHEEAATTLERLRQLDPSSPNTLYNAACHYSLCAAITAKDAGSTELSKSYSDAAIELLGSAIQNGFDQLDLLRTDDDLNAIRNRVEFQQLLNQHFEGSDGGGISIPSS